MVQKAAYTEGLIFAVQSIGLFKQVYLAPTADHGGYQMHTYVLAIL